jgi:hypothetical protein
MSKGHIFVIYTLLGNHIDELYPDIHIYGSMTGTRVSWSNRQEVNRC